MTDLKLLDLRTITVNALRVAAKLSERDARSMSQMAERRSPAMQEQLRAMGEEFSREREEALAVADAIEAGRITVEVDGNR